VRDIVEILTPFDANEAVQRIKLDALVKLKGAELDFRPFGAGGQATAVVLINSPRLLLDKTPGLATTLTERAKTSVVMLFVPDIDDWSLRRLPLFLPFVDLMLVSTPEMRDFLAAVSPVRVEVLRDPIDFCLLHSMEKSPGGEPPRVVWFGYAESYRRSMPPYQACLAALHRRRDIDYHIVTKQERYGPTPIGTIHEYVPERFLSLLETFDIGVLSHVPADHAVSTLWKSENKAALAINRGLAVAASRTPAYERLFTACGLEDFLFSSPSELAAILRRLTSWSERHRFLTQSQDYVLENYAATRMADDWLALYRDACARKFPVRPVP